MTVPAFNEATDSAGTPLRESMQRFILTQAEIVGFVRGGLAQLRWRELGAARGLYVMADALKIAGVRVPVSAETTAQLAELLGATPTTALLEDWIWNEADLKLEAPTFDPAIHGDRILWSNKAVLGFNDMLDKQILATKLPATPLIGGAGKSWILDNAALRKRGRAVNYGLHRLRKPTATHASADGRSYVVQTPGTAHNPEHWDYSQTCRLCRTKDGPVPLHQLPQRPPLQVSTLWI